MKIFQRHPHPIPTSYDATIVVATRYGVLTGCSVFAFFTVFYWNEEYPIQTVWLNLAALLLGLISWAILDWLQNDQLAAQLILLSSYIALAGPALYTGGILSTNMVWLVFIPVAATIMSGKHATALWGGISIMTAIGFFLLSEVWHINLNLHPPQTIDHLVDLIAVILVMIIATWLNEIIKLRYMRELETAQLTLHQQARVDPLTQSDNRRSLSEKVEQQLSMHLNSLLMLDIDHFKKINDTYGHSTGDQVLQWFSLNCKAKLRQGDILARLGGDEFVIFLPHTDIGEAQMIAERLRGEIAASPAQTTHGKIRVNISIGVASHSPQEHAELETLLNHADRALYQAKQNGRNRVRVSKI